MERVEKVVARVLKFIMDIEEFIAILCLSGILVFVTLGMLLRAVGRPLAWISPVTVLLFTWLTFVGAGVLFYRKEYIVVRFLVDRFPPFARACVELVINLFIVGFCLFLLYLAPKLITMQSQKALVLPFPRYVYSLPLFISSASILLSSLHEVLVLLQSIVKGHGVCVRREEKCS